MINKNLEDLDSDNEFCDLSIYDIRSVKKQVMEETNGEGIHLILTPIEELVKNDKKIDSKINFRSLFGRISKQTDTFGLRYESERSRSPLNPSTEQVNDFCRPVCDYDQISRHKSSLNLRNNYRDYEKRLQKTFETNGQISADGLVNIGDYRKDSLISSVYWDKEELSAVQMVKPLYPQQNAFEIIEIQISD